MALLFLFVFTALLLAAAICDIKTRLIPPVIPLLLCATAIFSPSLTIWQRIIGGIISGAVLLIPTLIIPNAFGGGDIKLVAACGFVLGAQPAIFALFISLGLSLAPCLYYQLTKKQTHIAFAPYLAVGFTLAAFFILI